MEAASPGVLSRMGQTQPDTVDIADFLTFNSNFNHSVATPYPTN